MFMNKAILFQVIGLVIFFLYGCKGANEIYYSYKSNWYAYDTEKRFITSNSLISYGDYLFEFKKRTNLEDGFRGESDSVTSTIHFDTIGVYLLGGKNRLYYEFDTFAFENKIVKAGKLSEKKFGQLYPDPISSEEIGYSAPVDTVINNIICFYSTVVPRNRNAIDSTVVKVILLKKPNFNSLYKIGGGEYPDKDYCIVGFSAYSFKNNDGFVQEVDALRPLTEKEKSICKSMLMKTKAAVVDTIRGVTLRDKKP